MTVAAMPGVKASQIRKVAQVAFIHGARAVPFGLLAGALLGWGIAQSGDDLRDTAETVKVATLIVGFILVPAAIAAYRVARSVEAAQHPLLGLSARTAAAAATGAAWGLAGALLAFGVGRLGALDLVLQPLLVLGGLAGAAAGVAFGVLVSISRALRGHRAEHTH